jgi:hypothetical protein
MGRKFENRDVASLVRNAGTMMLALAFPSHYGPTARYRPEDHYMRGPGPKWRAKHLAEPVASGWTAIASHRRKRP